jgi:hypothetical protein
MAGNITRLSGDHVAVAARQAEQIEMILGLIDIAVDPGALCNFRGDSFDGWR